MALKFIIRLASVLTIMQLCHGCEQYGQSYRERLADEKVYTRFGVKYNKIREELGIPLLPTHGWEGQRVLPGKELWVCELVKKGGDYDTTARHAMKEIYCYTSTGKPIREVDLYYSGRKYIEDDPDYLGWERLEIDYDYVSDSIPNILHHSNQSSYTNTFKKGRIQAFLVGPRQAFNSSMNEKLGVYLHLVRDTITLAQADSVLKSWGIKKSEELDQREFIKKKKP